MLKPYYSRYTPPHGVLADYSPDTGWTVVGKQPALPADLFHQLYTDEQPGPYTYWETGKPIDLDVDKALTSGTHTIEYLTDKQQVKDNHRKHPDAWYLDPSLMHAIRFRHFPLGWVGWVEPGRDMMQEADELWGTPLFALNPVTEVE